MTEHKNDGSTDAGAESPEEGEHAMAAAEEATVDEGADEG